MAKDYQISIYDEDEAIEEDLNKPADIEINTELHPDDLKGD